MAQLSSSKAKAVALAMTGLAAAATFPASAQQATQINSTAAAPDFSKCDKISNPGKQAECYVDARIAFNRATSAQARQHSTELDKGTACIKFLTIGVTEKRFTKEDVVAAADGKLTGSNACPVAVKFGYDRRAQLEVPSVK